MLTYLQDNYNNHYSFDPFNMFKYEQDMRDRQRRISQQRRNREAQMLARQRQQQEDFRRYQAEQLVRNQSQQEQDNGYQIVQDIYGQLYLIPKNHTSRPTMYEPFSDSDGDVSLDDSLDVRMNSRTDQQNKPMHVDPTERKDEYLKDGKSNYRVNKQQQQNDVTVQKRDVVVEDVSDSEEEEDTSKSLERTLRNRRPSPGQWIEPVDLLI